MLRESHLRLRGHFETAPNTQRLDRTYSTKGTMSAQVFTHPDGRKTEYLVSGAQDGFPFVFIHGTPGSYPVGPKMIATCEGKGIKLITLSRAGYGGSTRNKGRRVVDAVADIQALLEHLGVKKCAVGGKSGGGEFLFRVISCC